MTNSRLSLFFLIFYCSSNIYVFHVFCTAGSGGNGKRMRRLHFIPVLTTFWRLNSLKTSLKCLPSTFLPFTSAYLKHLGPRTYIENKYCFPKISSAFSSPLGPPLLHTYRWAVRTRKWWASGRKPSTSRCSWPEAAHTHTHREKRRNKKSVCYIRNTATSTRVQRNAEIIVEAFFTNFRFLLWSHESQSIEKTDRVRIHKTLFE